MPAVPTGVMLNWKPARVRPVPAVYVALFENCVNVTGVVPKVPPAWLVSTQDDPAQTVPDNMNK